MSQNYLIFSLDIFKFISYLNQQDVQWNVQYGNYATKYGYGHASIGNTGKKIFYFSGNSISLNSRLQSLSDVELQRIIDATIVVTGVQIIPRYITGQICTIIQGSFLIFLFVFMYCDWWKKCVYPSFQIAQNIYRNLKRLFSAPKLRNITITVMDNLFNAKKASILYDIISQSRLQGFTFINNASDFDYNSRQFSDFQDNMKPIKELCNLTSDIRWRSMI